VVDDDVVAGLEAGEAGAEIGVATKIEPPRDRD